MTWAKLDDRFHEHRKVRRAWRRSPAAVGLHAMAISYCAGHETDGFVDEEFVGEKLLTPAERRKVLAVLIEVGLWEEHNDGWLIHDFLEYNPSRADLKRTREWDNQRKALHRDRDLVAALRERDGDRCRYCGVQVDWRNRRGADGGTYDHVVPRGPNTLENVVVSCRHCNTTKNDRTPLEAGMNLLPIRSLGQNRSNSEPDQEQKEAGSVLTTDLHTRPDPTRPVEEHHPSTGLGYDEDAADYQPVIVGRSEGSS